MRKYWEVYSLQTGYVCKTPFLTRWGARRHIARMEENQRPVSILMTSDGITEVGPTTWLIRRVLVQ